MRIFKVVGVCLAMLLAACGNPQGTPTPVGPGNLTTEAGSPPPDAGTDGGVDAGTDAGADAGVDAGAPLVTVVDLRADVNRNGVVELDVASEDLNEDTWDDGHGAVFLANLDDDTDRCEVMQTSTRPYPDKTLAACHDAADAILNGQNDMLDLAPLKVKAWPEAPDNTVASLEVSTPGASYVRLFKNGASGYTDFAWTQAKFTVEELREGVELLLEGKDIVRDPAVWNGLVDVTLKVEVPGSGGRAAVTQKDKVRLRVSPVMTFHHNLPAVAVYATKVPQSSDSTAFINSLSTAVSSSMVSRPLVVIGDDDQWTQDNFEPGYMSMPSANGQHVIRVNYRSANLFNPYSSSWPLRPGGVVVYLMRGPDVAAIQEYTPNADSDMDSLNSMGNTETIPPYTHNGQSYPLGRLFRGSTANFFPDPRFSKMLASQGMQPPVFVDTSWLVVGHVDETITFVKANTPRGWALLVNDARLAKTMLEDLVARGLGDTRMFVGKKWVDDYGNEYSAEVTVSQVLANATVMAESASAAAEVDAQLAVLVAETGLLPSEIIRIPFLHDSYGGLSVAYQPGTINSLVVNDAFIVAPDPFGPQVSGQDLFKKQMSDVLSPLGYTVRFVDNWDLYHRLLGEVHCGSNTVRAIPEVKWWETGR